MILVSDAGWRRASALVACRTLPELASTTMDENGGEYADSRATWWRCPRWRRASAASVVMVTVAANVSKPKVRRRPREDAAIARNMKYPGPQTISRAQPDGVAMRLS